MNHNLKVENIISNKNISIFKFSSLIIYQDYYIFTKTNAPTNYIENTENQKLNLEPNKIRPKNLNQHTHTKKS